MEILKKIGSGIKTALLAIGKFFDKIAVGVGWVYHVIMRFRKLFISIPVVYGAVKLAMYNQEHLPEAVGLNLLENKVTLAVPEGNPAGIESFGQLADLLPE